MTATWTPATYRIVRRSGDDTILSGATWDDWGVGPSVAPDTPGSIVTHLPTGLACGEVFPTVGQARRFAEAIAPLRDDWASLTEGHRFDAAFVTLMATIASAILAEPREVLT